MKQLKMILPMCLLAGMLCGCSQRLGLPRAREMSEMALLRTMAVDFDHQLVLTVSTGRRASGQDTPDQAPTVISANHTSLSGAALEIQAQADSSVFYGYVDQLLLGETLAEQGVMPVLDYFVRDVELGMGAQVWLTLGQAKPIVTGEKKQDDEGVDTRLSSLQNDSDMGAAGLTRTVGELTSDILEDGASYVPALLQTDSGLLQSGYGILRGDTLIGWFTGEQAKGLELLENHAGADVVEGNLFGRRDVLRVQVVQTDVKPIFQGADVTGGAITCHVTADLVEFSNPLKPDELEALSNRLAEVEQSRIAEAVQAMQRWNADSVGLLRRIGMAAPSHWEQIQSEGLGALEFRITVEVSIRRAYGAIQQEGS